MKNRLLAFSHYPNFPHYIFRFKDALPVRFDKLFHATLGSNFCAIGKLSIQESEQNGDVDVNMPQQEIAGGGWRNSELRGIQRWSSSSQAEGNATRLRPSCVGSQKDCM